MGIRISMDAKVDFTRGSGQRITDRRYGTRHEGFDSRGDEHRRHSARSFGAHPQLALITTYFTVRLLVIIPVLNIYLNSMSR